MFWCFVWMVKSLHFTYSCKPSLGVLAVRKMFVFYSCLPGKADGHLLSDNLPWCLCFMLVIVIGWVKLDHLWWKTWYSSLDVQEIVTTSIPSHLSIIVLHYPVVILFVVLTCLPLNSNCVNFNHFPQHISFLFSLPPKHFPVTTFFLTHFPSAPTSLPTFGPFESGASNHCNPQPSWWKQGIELIRCYSEAVVCCWRVRHLE